MQSLQYVITVTVDVLGHYMDINWAPRHLKSLETWLSFEQFVDTNIKVPYY